MQMLQAEACSRNLLAHLDRTAHSAICSSQVCLCGSVPLIVPQPLHATCWCACFLPPDLDAHELLAAAQLHAGTAGLDMGLMS